jgi:hypothetical protein
VHAPCSILSRVCHVQGLSCPGIVVSRVCRVQGLSVQGLSVQGLSVQGLSVQGLSVYQWNYCRVTGPQNKIFIKNQLTLPHSPPICRLLSRYLPSFFPPHSFLSFSTHDLFNPDVQRLNFPPLFIRGPHGPPTCGILNRFLLSFSPSLIPIPFHSWCI